MHKGIAATTLVIFCLVISAWQSSVSKGVPEFASSGTAISPSAIFPADKYWPFKGDGARENQNEADWQRIAALNTASIDNVCKPYVFPTNTNCASAINSVFSTFDTIPSGTNNRGITFSLPQAGILSTTITLLTNDQITGQQCGGLSDFSSSPTANSYIIMGGGVTSGTFAIDTNQTTQVAGAGLSCSTIIPASTPGSNGIRLNSLNGSIDNNTIQFIGQKAAVLQGNASRVDFNHFQGLADYGPGVQPSAAIGVLEVPSADNYIQFNEIGCSTNGLTGNNQYASAVFDQSGTGFYTANVFEACDVGIRAGGLGTHWLMNRSDGSYGTGVMVTGNVQQFVGIDSADCSVGSPGTYPCFSVTGSSNIFEVMRSNTAGYVGPTTNASHCVTDMTTGVGWLRNYYSAAAVMGLNCANGKFVVAASGGAVIQTPHGDPTGTTNCTSAIALDDSSGLFGVGDIYSADGSPQTCAVTGEYPGMDIRWTFANANDCFAGVCGPGTFDFVKRGTSVGNGWQLVGTPPPLTATSGSLGGVALTAGNCSTTTVSVPGATTAMSVTVTPAIDPGDPFYWKGFVSSTNTVTAKVCAAVNGTPTASNYNIRVIR